MTSVLNSNYTHIRNKKHNTERDIEETVVPDSTTTIEKDKIDFLPGQDVLLKHKDGRYYLGTIVEVDPIREQCLVKFGDNTENWSHIKDLTKLNTSKQEYILCVVCKKSAPKDKNEITVCDKCGRGYHQRCHQPEMPSIYHKDGTWMCRRCLDSEPHRQKKYTVRDTCRKISNAETNTAGLFPYDIDSLNWDTYHRVNLEQIYCYCGGNGEWYTQMLQCGRCKQWFHENCVKCLQYPLYCGDRFYVFVCSICNEGEEFIRRLEIKWVDLVHLMLFNLTTYNMKKYYDLDTVIIPYINDNWHALQLPPKISGVSKPERRDIILSVLTCNRNRFKCGREIKKRTTIWGLRVRLPPPAPCVTLPPSGIICEEELKERWQGHRRLQFLPRVKSEIKCENGKRMIVLLDNHMRNIIMGTAYQHSSAFSETESPCPSPDGELEDVHSDISRKLYKNELLGAGCAKKSVPFSNVSLHRKKRMSINNRKHKKKDCAKEFASKDNSRNSGENLPLTPPTSVSAPPTPPTSATPSGSDLLPDYSDHSNSLVQNLNELSKGINSKLTKSNVARNNLDLNNLELNTPCDTSGDETSSKSTLDLIIPPPKDFKGNNNPFLALLIGNNEDHTKKRRSKDSITLPLPLTAVIPGRPIVRPTKRQLSEKDICIGPNGEVKRRRLRRNRSSQSVYSLAQPTASKTATVVPVRPDAKEWGQRTSRSSLNQTTTNGINNCMDYALNARRLRQRHDKSQDKEKPSNPPTPKPSPVKQEPDIDIDDLKSSVNIYFGAANRIATGERFSVKAKRVSSSGKVQFLLEWEGPSNGMT